MDEFEKWFRNEYHNVDHPSVWNYKNMMEQAYQAGMAHSAKYDDVMDAVAAGKERKQIVKMIREVASGARTIEMVELLRELADRIEGGH